MGTRYNCAAVMQLAKAPTRNREVRDVAYRVGMVCKADRSGLPAKCCRHSGPARSASIIPGARSAAKLPERRSRRSRTGERG